MQKYAEKETKKKQKRNKNMATAKIILSSRLNKDGRAKVLIRISHKSTSLYIQTGVDVYPHEFSDGIVIGRKDSKGLNNIIDGFYSQIKLNLLSLSVTTDINSLSPSQLRDRLSPNFNPDKETEEKNTKNSFCEVFRRYNDTHSNIKTKALYDRTMKALREFDKDIEGRGFNEIDGSYINRFKSSRLERESLNTITIHLTHIRAVFNYAIYDLEITHNYPFRKKHGANRVVMEQTDAKVQPMPLEHLREIFSHQHSEQWQLKWIDLAKLVFLLIGINMADLSELREIDSFGYITYRRKKTRDRSRNGAVHRVKIEPEAMEIIERWRGKDHLLSHFDDRADYASASKQMVHAVKCLGLSTPACKGGRKATAAESRKNKRGITNQSRYGYFCLYSLRKAWATIAFNYCQIPMEIISMALGHSDGKGMSVTQRYVQFENRLVDEANRKVIDFILYNKNGEVK